MVFTSVRVVAVATILFTGSINSFAADATAGAQKAALCGGCHGPEGISFSPEIPNLAGQKAEYLVKAVNDFKSGARKNPMMSAMVGGLVDADIADIAAFYSSITKK